MIGEIGGGVWDEYLVRTNNANYESSVIEVITCSEESTTLLCNLTSMRMCYGRLIRWHDQGSGIAGYSLISRSVRAKRFHPDSGRRLDVLFIQFALIGIPAIKLFCEWKAVYSSQYIILYLTGIRLC